MPKINLDLDKVNDGSKITLGQIPKLSHEKQIEIFKPIVEANSKRIAEVFNDVSNLSETIRSIGNIKPQLTNFLENIKLPEFNFPTIDYIVPEVHSLATYNPPLRVGKSKLQIEREKREDYVNKLQIQILERELNKFKGVYTPQYDISTGIITFMGKDVVIPLNTNLEMVCRVVLKNMSNMTKHWSWDEIVEEMRESKNNFTSRQIYTSARAINEKVAQETAIKDFFITKPITTVRLNPKFVPK